MSARIQELDVNASVDSFFVVATVQQGTARTGSTYFSVSLRDRTGSMAAKVWRPETGAPDGVEAGKVYRVTGRVEQYRDELQLNIERLSLYRPLPEELAELVPASRWRASDLMASIREHISTNVRSSSLRRLLLHVLNDADVNARFSVSPAATGNHHAYRSGLAEHTLSMMRLATLTGTHYASYYPGLVDTDLLVAGTLLHDLGKIWELGGDLVAEYTTVGRLVGHIPMGAVFIERKARELGDVPEALVIELQHLILSHHGELEYGSPTRPATVEAQILHYIDNLDAKTNVFAMETSDSGWTGFHKTMGRPLLNPSSLRAAWTTPPHGELRTDGPGTPSRPTSKPRAESAVRTESAKVETTATRPADVVESAVRAGEPAAAEGQTRDATTGKTLSLFDGL